MSQVFHPVSSIELKIISFDGGNAVYRNGAERGAKFGVEKFEEPAYNAITGTVNFVINAELIFTKGLALTDTAEGLLDFLRAIKSKREYFSTEIFCCECGDYGCTHVAWDGKLEDVFLYFDMHNLIDQPYGKQFYKIEWRVFLEATKRFIESFLDFMDEHKITGDSSTNRYRQMLTELMSL